MGTVTHIGPPDYALAIILKAWFDYLENNEAAWDSALHIYPDEIRARARKSFLSGNNGLKVYGGYPRVDEKPPIVSVILLNETVVEDHMGQAVGMTESYDDEGDMMEVVGDISQSTVGVYVIAQNDEMGHIYSTLVRQGALIAQRRMLDSGFANMLFNDASDLSPTDVGLPNDVWVRTYTYTVLEQVDAVNTLPDGEYIPAVVEIYLKRIIDLEPPLNNSGVVPVANVE
ncbi:MAG: hypothetical protein WC262_09795 [Bacteroidales bacterium]|jgi:hypothetical protein